MNPHKRQSEFHAGCSVLATVLCLCGLPALHAQESPVLKINAAAEQADIKVTPLRGGVSMLEGSGGNIGVLSDGRTKFLVDAGISVSKGKLADALSAMGPGKITHVVNTHWHWDHADGNPVLPGSDIVVVAHPRTAAYLSGTERVDDWNYTFPPLPKSGQPTDLVSTRKQYPVGDEVVQVMALPPAHTDGDLTVYFRKADVLFLGDIFWNGVFPFIDNEHGGSIDGMIRAVDIALKEAGPRTIIVPGHGPVATRPDLVAFGSMLKTVRESVAKLKEDGSDEKSAVAAKPTAPFDARWGKFVIDPDFFVHLVYDGLVPHERTGE